MEIRCTIRNLRVEKGPILAATAKNQKVHLISRDSGGTQEGTYVLAERIRDENKYAIYSCISIATDRMVVRFILADGMAQTFIEYNGERNSYWGAQYTPIEPLAEIVTQSDFSDPYGREPYSSRYHNEWLMLIKVGKEGRVLEILEKFLENKTVYQFACSHPYRMTEVEKAAHDGKKNGHLCPDCQDDARRQEEKTTRMLADWPESEDFPESNDSIHRTIGIENCD